MGLTLKLHIFFWILLAGSPAYSLEYILKMNSGVSINEKTLNGKVLGFNPAAGLYKVKFESLDQIASLRNQKDSLGIQFLVENQIIQLSKNELRQVPEVSPRKQWNLEKVKAEAAWEIAGNRGSRSIVVAVIDTGIDGDHPDLKGNVLLGYNFLTGKPGGKDDNGHGTHCAGIIGATGSVNGGVLGISPDVSLLPLKFLTSQGLGDLYTGIVAIDYAIEQKVDVISSSWGAQISKPELREALREAAIRADQAGIIFVSSAGNLNRDNDLVDQFPANSGTPSILSVAGTDPNDLKMKISNFGSINVKVAAPGIDIVSTVLKGKYAKMTGTSMATPLVAGLAALLKAQRPDLKASEIRDIIVNTGHPIEIKNLCKCRIDAEAAMRSLKN